MGYTAMVAIICITQRNRVDLQMYSQEVGELGFEPAFLSSGPCALHCGAFVLLSQQENLEGRESPQLRGQYIGGPVVHVLGARSEWLMGRRWSSLKGLAQEKGLGVCGTTRCCFPQQDSQPQAVRGV